MNRRGYAVFEEQRVDLLLVDLEGWR